MEVRKLSEEEKPAAMRLAWEVFLAVEGPDYPAEGLSTFRHFVEDPQIVRSLEVYGAFEGGVLTGMIALRPAESHVSLFFVRPDRMRRGVGRRLFECAVGAGRAASVTVNSSSYAVGVYRRLGFVAMGEERVQEGIRYTPMRYERGE